MRARLRQTTHPVRRRLAAPRAGRCSAPLFTIALLLLAPLTRAQSIQKLVAFPTADSVRIQLFLDPKNSPQNLSLSAEITPLTQGAPLWKGNLQTHPLARTGNTLECTLTDLKPSLWSPATPTLYTLKVTATQSGKTSTKSLRLGFRSFESRDGHCYLNGHPIVLRGIAHNPPGRTIPDAVGKSRQFAYDYVKFLRSQNVNLIRLQEDSQEWFDVCDELGMMLYQGFYGSPPRGLADKLTAAGPDNDEFENPAGLNRSRSAPSAKDHPPKDVAASIAAYKDTFQTYAHHPSIVIYILSNELPYTGERGKQWHEFLTKVHADLSKWDTSRPFIGNAGYGQGREGDINDVHRYWGWYYNSFLTYYNLRDAKLFGEYDKNQPLTFSECVGNFTAPTGEYNLIEKKQLGAAIGWCGWAEDQAALANEHQCRVLKHAAESFRRLRPINNRLAGLMPFTILFDHWQGIRSFADMHPKPAMHQMATSYQPILTSWELWTSQVYAGSTITPTVHIVNDSEDFSALTGATLTYTITSSDNRDVATSTITLPTIAYYNTWSQRLDIPLPKDLPTGDYTLKATVTQSNKQISHNQEHLFIAAIDCLFPSPRLRREGRGEGPTPALQITLHDPDGTTSKALTRLHIPFKTQADLSHLDPRTTALVIGENATSLPTSSDLSTFLMHGGRILCLAQDPKKLNQDWLPTKVEFFTASANDYTYPPAHRPTRDQSNLNPQRPNHPIFQGITRRQLQYFSDYTGWDQTKPGFPAIYPVTRGFKITDEKSLANTAILINYDRGLEGNAVAEFFDGPGSVVLSGLDLISRSGLDPVADRMLRNLVLYIANDQPHDVHPSVTSKITWGNYPTQQGVLAGPIQGLLINVVWTPPKFAPTTKPLTRDQGAWNTKPSDQFIPKGIRAIGPYAYSTGTAPRPLDRAAKTGSGFFWAKLPPGKVRVRNIVQNPTKDDRTLTIETGRHPGVAQKVPAGKSVLLVHPLPDNARDVCIRYTGDNELVILETSFE
ncbi:MAG TPA: glycoside hydrolase family 2 TIM barrel-domain containing protein [Tepidisphaeraceae bacterium]